MRDTFGLQHMLEWRCGILNGFRDLLGDGAIHHSSDHVPTTMPRMPPPGFCNAVPRHNLSTSNAAGGISSCQQTCELWKKCSLVRQTIWARHLV